MSKKMSGVQVLKTVFYEIVLKNYSMHNKVVGLENFAETLHKVFEENSAKKGFRTFLSS
jgi:hypothetical protein